MGFIYLLKTEGGRGAVLKVGATAAAAFSLVLWGDKGPWSEDPNITVINPAACHSNGKQTASCRRWFGITGCFIFAILQHQIFLFLKETNKTMSHIK